MNKELKISAENALAAYNNTDANGRELLEHLPCAEVNRLVALFLAVFNQ